MTHIREITIDDAEAFLELCLHLDRETPYMMYEPDERTTTVAQQRDIVAGMLASPNSTIIVADQGDVLVGYVAAYGGEFRRIQHSAYVVAGVRASVAGQGLGRRLFEALEDWARRKDIQRLELTVRVDNNPAIRLYQRMGYEIEGTKRQSLIVDGQPIDELYMARLLESSRSSD